jgi:hypothetical protein
MAMKGYIRKIELPHDPLLLLGRIINRKQLPEVNIPNNSRLSFSLVVHIRRLRGGAEDLPIVQRFLYHAIESPRGKIKEIKRGPKESSAGSLYRWDWNWDTVDQINLI